MKEDEIKIFVNSITNYFNSISGGNTKIDTRIPYCLNEDEEYVFLKYTAIITITGIKEGLIYVSMDQQTVEAVLQKILGIESDEDDVLLDMVGEVANTISGNVRKVLGEDFIISQPACIQGEIHKVQKSENPLVFPVHWNDQHTFYIVISFNKE